MTTESSGQSHSDRLFAEVENLNMRITPAKELRRAAAADMADPALASLGADLRAVATTTPDRADVIARFLQLGVSRSNMLCSGWIEVPVHGKPVMVDSHFSNPALDNKSIRSAMTTIAGASIEARRNTVTPVENIRGASIVSVPFFIDGETAGAFCGMVHDNRANCNEALLVCQMVTTHYDVWRARDEFTRLTFEVRSTASVLELVGKAQSTESVSAACYSIANELKKLFGCDFVAIGLRRPNKIGSSLMAVSSTADFERESRTTQLFCGAFDEAVMHEAFTCFPPMNTGTPKTASLAHKRLARHMRCDAVMSVPVRNHEEDIIGAVTLLGNRELNQNPSTRQLIHALEHPLGGTVEVVKRAEGGWWQKFRRRLIKRSNRNLKRAAAIAFALILAAMFIPVSYRVPCHCTAEPDVRRVSVAPYEGLLETTFAEPGDIVTRGQLIARMDGREIRLEQAAIEFEKTRAMRKQDAMMANDMIPDAMMAELEYRNLEQRERLLQHRADHIDILSPIDGIVLSGSIDRRENHPVKLGESLFEIAPLNPIRVELAVPADEVMRIATGQKVKFRFDGFGTDTIEGVVERIRPASSVRNERNVFIAEAVIDNSDGLVRPGMEGSARVHGNTMLLGWTLFHRPVERIAGALGF